MEKIEMVKCNLKQWGLMALLAGGMLFPAASTPLLAEAGASPARAKTATMNTVGESAADRRAIMEAYRQADAAYDDFDLEGVWRNRSEAFYLIEEGGKRFTADALKEDLAWVFKTIEAMKSTTAIQKIAVQGNKATVEARNSSVMSVPTSETGSSTMNFAFRSTDTWVKQNGRWIFAHTKVHSSYMMNKGQLPGANSPEGSAGTGSVGAGNAAGGSVAAGKAPAGKLPVATVAQSQAARKSIQIAYNRMVAAAARKDIRGALGNRTADYTVILRNGNRISGDVMEKSLMYTYNSATSIKSWSVIEKFELRGDTATVTVRASSTTLFPATRYRERTVLKSSGRALDTWVKRDGQWFIAQSKTLSIRGTANGKAMPVL